MNRTLVALIFSMFYFTFASLADLPAQVLTDNLLKNPGAESQTDGWVDVAGTMTVSTSIKYNETSSFSLDWDGAAEQKVDVSAYAQTIDAGLVDAFVGGWAYTDFTSTEVAIRLKYYDSLGFEIGSWEQPKIQSYRIWKEIKFRTTIPKSTRSISFVIKSSYDGSYLDDLLLQFYYTPIEPTPTPTVEAPTPTPIPTLTPTVIATPTPIESKLTAIYTNHFNEGTASDNHLLYFTPGAAGDYTLGDVSFRPLIVTKEDNLYTDGYGVSITVDPGEGVTFYEPPLSVDNDYVYLRIGVWTSAKSVSLALGALDAKPSDSLASAEITGSIEFNLMMDVSRFVNHFGYLEAFYKPERGAIVPVFQVANGQNEQVTVQFDNLEIYRIPQSAFSIVDSSSQ